MRAAPLLLAAALAACSAPGPRPETGGPVDAIGVRPEPAAVAALRARPAGVVAVGTAESAAPAPELRAYALPWISATIYESADAASLSLHEWTGGALRELLRIPRPDGDWTWADLDGDGRWEFVAGSGPARRAYGWVAATRRFELR